MLPVRHGDGAGSCGFGFRGGLPQTTWGWIGAAVAVAAWCWGCVLRRC